MNREQWLAERRTGIGSSDAPAVCGLSKWSNPLTVYLDKLGRLPEPEMTPQMAWGLRLEPAIAAAYEEATSTALTIPMPIMRHADIPFMLASIDRLSKDGKRVVELKTCSAYHQNEWGEPGTDEVPEAYLVQVTHQLAVSGLQIADIAVLIGGTDFRIYTVERSDALIDRLVEIENDFWTRVCHEIPPEPDWSDRHTPRLLEALHGLDESMLVNLDDAALSVCDEWLMWKEHQKLADEKVLEYKGRLLDKLGPCGTGVLPDGRLLVRKQVHRNPYTVEAGTYTTMRIKKAKVST